MSQNPSLLLDARIPNLSESDTAVLASATAAMVVSAMKADPNNGCRIYLHGQLGAGKTTWVRAFLRACGIDGRIKSPSFSVVESYEHDGITFHHLDFYRQTDPHAWQGGGLRDVMTENAVTLVEWPEHAAGLPTPHMEIWIDWEHPDQAEGPRQLRVQINHPEQGLDLTAAVAAWKQSIDPLLPQS